MHMPKLIIIPMILFLLVNNGQAVLALIVTCVGRSKTLPVLYIP